MANGKGLEDWLKALYHSAEGMICGKHPYVRPWHFQWLSTKDLYADLERVLPQLHGSVLDVGCGEKPYRNWAKSAGNYVGIDISPGTNVDVVASATDGWPFADNVFDNVLCTQVLEHVVDLRGALSEIGRVIKPGGTVIVTVPFIYHEHGAPFDYRRFSIYGAKQYFAKHYEITELKRQGGIGSTLGLLWLAWIELEMARWRATRFLKGACFPLWVVYCGLVNGLCYLIDRLDRTQSAYSNLLIIVRKKATETNGVITCGVSVPSTSAKTPH